MARPVDGNEIRGGADGKIGGAGGQILDNGKVTGAGGDAGSHDRLDGDKSAAAHHSGKKGRAFAAGGGSSHPLDRDHDKAKKVVALINNEGDGTGDEGGEGLGAGGGAMEPAAAAGTVVATMEPVATEVGTT